jgi:hypothetical protein
VIVAIIENFILKIKIRYTITTVAKKTIKTVSFLEEAA